MHSVGKIRLADHSRLLAERRRTEFPDYDGGELRRWKNVFDGDFVLTSLMCWPAKHIFFVSNIVFICEVKL